MVDTLKFPRGTATDSLVLQEYPLSKIAKQTLEGR